MTIKIVSIPESESGQRLDRWLKTKQKLPFTMIQKLIRKGRIRVNTKKVDHKVILNSGDEIKIPVIGDLDETYKPAIRLDENILSTLKKAIIYEDRDILVLNKPNGFSVQGGTKQSQHLDHYLDALSKEGEHLRLIHRLDKDTSGLLLLAKTRKAAAFYTKAFAERDMEKTYLAITRGVPTPLQGHIKKAITHNDKSQAAETVYKVLDYCGKEVALVALWPKSGRKHQVRIHCESLGCPILGDEKYSPVREDEIYESITASLHLHAWKLSCQKPNGQKLTLQAPISKTMKKTLTFFGMTINEKDDS